MDELRNEVESIQGSDYRLSFSIPTDDQLHNMRQIHRERTAGERARANEAESALRNFIEAMKRGDTSLEELPIELKTDLANYFAGHRGEPN